MMVTKNIADFALEYRFFVKGFYEGSDKKPYSLGKAGSIDWNKNASVGEEYLKQLHRHQWFIPQAKVYRVSGDEKYIKSWIEVYSDWITQNPQPAEGPNTNFMVATPSSNPSYRSGTTVGILQTLRQFYARMAHYILDFICRTGRFFL